MSLDFEEILNSNKTKIINEDGTFLKVDDSTVKRKPSQQFTDKLFGKFFDNNNNSKDQVPTLSLTQSEPTSPFPSKSNSSQKTKRRKPPAPIIIPSNDNNTRRRSTSLGSALLSDDSSPQQDSKDFQSISLERIGIPTSPAFNAVWYSNSSNEQSVPPTIVEHTNPPDTNSVNSTDSKVKSNNLKQKNNSTIPSPLPSPRISSLAFGREKSTERSTTPTSTNSTITRTLSTQFSNLTTNDKSDDLQTPVISNSPSIRLIQDNNNVKDENNSTLPSSPDAPSTSTPDAPSTSIPDAPSTSTSYPTNNSAVNSNNNSADVSADYGLKCWNEDEAFLPKEKHAQYLGTYGTTNQQALNSYMNQFNFNSLRLDEALRKLTSKLYLRAETQQIDRILEAFSVKFFNDNPLPVYLSSDAVHAISYSILLLNTDLHIADLQTHMSRAQFIKNTLNVVQNQCNNTNQFSNYDFNDDNSSINSSKTNNNNTTTPISSSSKINSPPPSSYNLRKNKLGRNGSLSSVKSNLAPNHITTSSPSTSSLIDDKAARKSASIANFGNYEHNQLDSGLEPLLREIYNSIRYNKILLPLDNQSSSNLSTGNVSRQRLPRNLSNASISTSSFKRGSIRGLQNLLSNEGRVSPTPSIASALDTQAPTPSIGFASNLSQTIIKEQQEDKASQKSYTTLNSESGLILSDEELALMGAPWGKEGFLQRKHYYEVEGRRSKDRNWLECFVVIGKGDLKMFTFGDAVGVRSGQEVGGGNWTNNANLVGEIPLSHSQSDSLKMGYNRSRPHCFQLTLPSGGKYYFQAGTDSLVDEWVSTCNYWAARSSKEPLSGGVSNMEFGWNSVLQEFETGNNSNINKGTEDDVMSIRSNYSLNKWRQPFRTNADRMYIEEWTSPQLPIVSSKLEEEEQIEALYKFSSNLKSELRIHRLLYDRMLQLYSTRSSNREKAQNNWNRKLRYLVNECKKYDRYIACLNSAIYIRKQKQHEKQLEKALAEADESSESDDE